MPTERKKHSGSQSTAYNWLKIGAVALSYFLVEVFAYILLQSGDPMRLAFGGAWALLLSAVVLHSLTVPTLSLEMVN